MSALPPLRVDPGWYWWLIMPQDQKDYSAFTAANRGKMFVRKVFRGQSETNEVIVFEVKEPIAWTLATPPAKARKGFKTELDDLIKGPAPDPHWTVALTDILGKPLEKAREAGSALTLVLWGGAAIVLFNLFRATAPARAAATEPATEDA
jgi:hypothetical protein